MKITTSENKIIQELLSVRNDSVLFTIDLVRNFRNLRGDPVDRLEFDMKLGGKLYIDGAIKFSWVCCSAGFQMTLESELYFIHRNVYSAALVIISGSYTQKKLRMLKIPSWFTNRTRACH